MSMLEKLITEIQTGQTQELHALANRLHTSPQMIQAMLDHLGIASRVPMAHLARDDRRRLLHALAAWSLPVVDSGGYAHAEVTAGGVPLTEVAPATMMSRKCPGLFLAGEILDVDGRLGGFNLQWAWSSAYVAAAGIAERFEKAGPGAYTRDNA